MINSVKFLVKLVKTVKWLLIRTEAANLVKLGIGKLGTLAKLVYQAFIKRSLAARNATNARKDITVLLRKALGWSFVTSGIFARTIKWSSNSDAKSINIAKKRGRLNV